MAKAPNAEELPALLAFLAQATTNALKSGSTTISGEPFGEWDTWRKQTPRVNPPPLAVFDLVNRRLVAAGFAPQ